MAEGVRIVAECDGLAAPWEGGARLYRFAEGTVLLLLRKDDPRFLKVAYDGQLLFVPRSMCVEVEVTGRDQLKAAGAERLVVREPKSPAPREPWRAREVAGAAALLILLPALGVFYVPFVLVSASLLAPALLWCLAGLLIAFFVGAITSRRAAVWGALAGGLLAYALAAIMVGWLSTIEI